MVIMSTVSTEKKNLKLKVWTPLKKPPHPDTVQLMSDEARLVLAALRKSHRKKVEIWQRRYQQSKDISDGKSSYYHQIYRDSFKTECSTSATTRQEESASYVCQSPPMSHLPSLGAEGGKRDDEVSVGLAPTVKQGPDNKTQKPMYRYVSAVMPGNHCQENMHTREGQELLPSHLQGNVDKVDEVTATSPNDMLVTQPRSDHNLRVTSLVCSPTTPELGSLHVHVPVDGHPTMAESRFNEDAVRRSVMEDDKCGCEQLPYYIAGDKHISAVDANLPHVPISKHGAIPHVNMLQLQESIFPTKSPCPSSRIDAEGTNDNVTFRQRPQDLPKLSSKIPTCIDSATNTNVGKLIGSMFCTPERAQVDKTPISKIGNQSSTLDVKLSTDGQDSQKSSRSTKLNHSKQEAASSSSIIVSTKRKIVPEFGSRSTGQKDKQKRKSNAPSQVTLEEVMGGGKGSAIGAGDSPASIGPNTITSLSASELAAWQKTVAQADQILMMLAYTDGSSQLRELEELKNKRVSSTAHSEGAACRMITAVQKRGRSGYTSLSFPLAGQDADTRNQVRSNLLELLECDARKVCFDAQELIHALVIHNQLDPQAGCNKWRILDPKVACWLLDPDNPPVTFSGMLKTYLKGKYELTPPETLGSLDVYSRDLALLGPVMRELIDMLKRYKLWELFINVEVPLIPILSAMEVHGILVDEEVLRSYGNILKREIKKAETQCYQAAGHPFQINSHVQLRQVLFDELKLDELCPGQRLARTNVQNLKSTSETVLLKLKGIHPLPELVLSYRQLVKLKSTYIDGLVDYITAGYIHTSWEQTSAASGRIQSANPNIQNIPKQAVHVRVDDRVSETGRPTGTGSPTLWMREPFISHEGWSLIAADFQSIELRILAHLSQDPVLLRVFSNTQGKDIFVQLTCEWLGMKPEDVKTTDRERTKRIVYSVIYGVGPERLAETLGDTNENAKTFTKSFLGKFKGIRSFTHRCISECQRHGLVQTIFHRRRLIANINSQNFHVRSHAERQAVNFVVQGSAADICKLAMIHTMQELAEKPSLRARLLVQIHDELLFEVIDEDVEKVKGLIKSVMESTPKFCEPICQLKVPLTVSVSAGKTWGHLQLA